MSASGLQTVQTSSTYVPFICMTLDFLMHKSIHYLLQDSFIPVSAMIYFYLAILDFRMFLTLANCQVCHAQMSKSALEYHIRTHSSVNRTFKCENGCEECYFETVQELKDHIKYFHQIVNKRPILTVLNTDLFLINDSSENVAEAPEKNR